MACLFAQTMGYSVFSEHVYDLVAQERVPLIVSVEVTLRCNMRCRHCYIPFSERAGENQQAELSLAEYNRYLSEFADSGTLWLLLTGGEPFVRQDFLDIYDLAKRKGFILSLFTNGILLNRRIVDHLAEYRPFNIEISLYGATQETYERVTGIPGSFKRCMQGIEMLMKAGLPLKLKSAIMTLNQHELPPMRQIAKDFGLKFYFDPIITAAIDGDLRPLEYRLPVESVINLEQEDEDRASAWQELYATEYDLGERSRRVFICSAAVSGFHLDPYGVMSPCITARHPRYDLRQGSFREAWESFFPKMMSQEFTSESPCIGCQLRGNCNQCPGIAVLEMGDMEKPVPFLCEMAHAREAVFSPVPVSAMKVFEN